VKKKLSEKKIRKKQEHEANVFAVCLLIPRDELLKDLETMEFDLGDEKSEDLKRLCKKYGVSTSAMTFRLSILKQTSKVN
jgi:Zn-dependent peptidase ImmA (M78 family)